jgi:nucleotide-binding universal stress UspA family protein
MLHILIPTDLSDTSFKAATFAFDLFGTGHVRYTVVHTYLKTSFDNALLPGIGDSTKAEAVNGLRRFERRCRKYAGKMVLAQKASPSMLTDVLNELARKKGAHLIVMGTQGAGNYGRVGSNASAVVMGAIAPVITVPTQWVAARVSRIMLAYDGGKLTRSTVQPLIDLAKRTNAEVVLAHVRDKSAAFEKPADRKHAGELFDGVPIKFVTVQGDEVVKTIDDLARQGRIQLMAMIHRKKGFWKGLFHSSKAKRMALHTTMPLLVLPERA